MHIFRPSQSVVNIMIFLNFSYKYCPFAFDKKCPNIMFLLWKWNRISSVPYFHCYHFTAIPYILHVYIVDCLSATCFSIYFKICKQWCNYFKYLCAQIQQIVGIGWHSLGRTNNFQYFSDQENTFDMVQLFLWIIIVLYSDDDQNTFIGTISWDWIKHLHLKMRYNPSKLHIAFDTICLFLWVLIYLLYKVF